MLKALAYVNWGRWVADCPVDGCTDARAIYPTNAAGEPTGMGPVIDHVCTSGHPFMVELPAPTTEAQIVSALSERASEKRKNWFPKGHPLAVLTGQPHGQSVRDLRREAEVGEARDAAAIADRRAALLAELKDAGITANEAVAALKGV